MRRKPQQQTLSIRIPEDLRQYLERAKDVISSNRDEAFTASDMARLLIEAAKDDKLDDRLEMAELRANPTRALWQIRCRWEQQLPLSRAEWMLLAQYVQFGCEELVEDPDLPTAESLARVLEGFLSVRALRIERGVELDRYYLGNLGVSDAALLSSRQIDADVVPKAVRALMKELREGTPQIRPVFVGRNLFVALRDESLEGVAAVNCALFPHWPALYRLAARGHWLRQRRPLRPSVRAGSAENTRVSSATGEECRLSLMATDEGELELLMEFPRRGVTYPIRRYPRIREFARLLTRLESGRVWTGRDFVAESTAEADGTMHVHLRGRSGIVISFASEEWNTIKSLVEQIMTATDVQRLLDELSLRYGDI